MLAPGCDADAVCWAGVTAAALPDPFRPFVVEADDGARLVLQRPRTATGWLLRVCMYLLLLLLVVMLLLIPWAVLTRGDGIGDVATGASFMVTLWIILRLLLFAFAIEGTRRIVVERGRLDFEARGVVRRSHEEVLGVVAFVVRNESRETMHGSVRWLRLQARTHGRVVDLGTLHLDPDGEPTREAAARAAAATIAERLVVPIEYVGDTTG